MPPTSTSTQLPTPLPLSKPTMPPQSTQFRRTRPSHVQTNLPSNIHLQHVQQQQQQQQQSTMPASTISASSVASSSQQGSPVMSPETAVMTSNSSLQASPEHRGRELVDDQFSAGSFSLPESVISRKTSDNSLGQTLVGSPSAMSEAVSKSNNIIRRLSNRATARFARRRTSSAAPNSRDGSVGPGMLRRRSDSNTTAPPDLAAYSDSDDEIIDEMDDFRSLTGGQDGALRESSSNSTTASLAGSTSPSNTTAGPVIPFQLLKGTWIRKVSKKNWKKRFILVLEPDAAKISWDKNRPHKCLYIDDIKEIRTGSDIRQYRIDYGVPESEESRWFSIMYAVPDKSKTKMMHLVADDASTFYNWVTTLEAISKHRQDLMASLMAFNDRAIRDYWLHEMTKQGGEKPLSLDDGDIDFEGVQRVCRNLHIHASPGQLLATFYAADATVTGRLNFFEFQTFVGFMKRREDIRQIYHQIAANPEAGLTVTEFLKFLRDDQGENVDADLPGWEALYSKFARKFRPRDADKLEWTQAEGPRMGDAAFAAYLTSTYNLPVRKEPKEYTLDRPLNEYFVSSSHNTYLMGRQVAGLSSVEGYISALARGCRCVEVDCWDGPDGNPTVNHGRTLTTSISFQETMTTINKYAFVKTKYPLWISLEVHCNPAQQAEMARIIKETFGARLVTEPLDPSSDKFPSPEQLKERVLIKVKRPQPSPEPTKPAESTGRRRGNSLSSPYPKPVQLDNSIVPSQSLPQSPILSPSHSSRRLVSKSRVNTITEGEVQDALSSSTSDNDSAGERVPPRRSSNKTVKVLGDLGVYCAGVKFGGFDATEAKAYNHIFSFMESSFMRNSKSTEEKRAIELHNMRYLMRVYPDRTRITSNNFTPIAYWRKGVQMAALNWQTFDLGMQLNQAMYESGTDRSGYVLKPTELREIKVMPPGWEGLRERQEVTFTVDVISAQQLMRPNGMPNNKTVDPYVEVEVFHSNDKRDKRDADGEASVSDTPLKFRTRVIRENGFNPIFDGKFTFKVTTKFPELIFIRWSVKLSHNGESYNDRQPVATHTAKLNGLKRGYRTLPLFDHNGEQYLFSTLFCRVNINSVQTILITKGEELESTGISKPRGVGRVFNTFGTRSNNISPKSSMEKAT
ncbi:phosphatidylinositol-specific phospholipase C [Colletotrichum orchidophilum]|uniref:Phosphoinositide phospholipase C n=1 Tax=Colletotrichum orchidophilum TaxID=1209926 RepID=A0A1G4BN06_9PEZI|nr:phosphatidylinositol-specific phospholipase C [Colletotrichum orchidophilum]OHF02794.1 phosphatidylinositol-specific phospholipase C [Colletotrichum orchidophilum]